MRAGLDQFQLLLVNQYIRFTGAIERSGKWKKIMNSNGGLVGATEGINNVYKNVCYLG
jgi:hypothetical protein